MSTTSSQEDGARLRLRVKNLPGVLSADAVASLLGHYGAAHVKLLKDASASLKAKRAPQTAIASFTSIAERERALVQLGKLQLAGHRVRAELIEDTSVPPSLPEEPQNREKAPVADAKPVAPPLPKGPPPPLLPAPPVAQRAVGISSSSSHSYYAPAPLAPHLGLHFAPSPLLEYKYPKANEVIVRNIANALIALPKFYTQVLHLMNKMNLPPPFDERAIPGMFSKDREEKAAQAVAQRQGLGLKRRFPGAQPATDFLIEEDEDESEEDALKAAEELQESSTAGAKKPRVNGGSSGAHAVKPVDSLSISRPPHADDSAAAFSKPTAPVLSAVTHTSKPKRLASSSSGIAKAFASSQGALDASRSVRPGVISEAELNRQRLPLEDLMQCPLMATYNRGAAPSRTLLVRNLAETVDEQDLVFVFGHILPLTIELSVLQIEISSASRSATIAFPSKELAAEALDKIHGVALEALPLVVSFCRELPGAVEERTTGSGDSSHPHTLTMDELDSQRLESSAFANEKFMRNYQRGEPSTTLYVKNLAKDVDERDLLVVFGAVVAADNGDLREIKIRHFTEGRMKCQAFVEYPSVTLAARALEKIHGVVLKDKPLIVCFRKSPAPCSDATPAPAAATQAHP